MKKLLIDLGISPNAVSIYLEVLQNGACSVDRLAIATGIKRTSVYPYINELKSLELISWNERDTGKAVTATDPKKLLFLAEQQHREAERKKQNVEDLISNLEAMRQCTDDAYSVFKYVGADQCKKALEQVYSNPQQDGYCGEFIYKDIGMKWYENHLRHMYKDLHIHDRVIFPIRAVKKFPYKSLVKTTWFDRACSEYRVHPTLDLPQGLDVYVLKDRVLTLLTDPEPTCIVVKSQKFRDFEKSLFDALFATSVPINEWSNI